MSNISKHFRRVRATMEARALEDLQIAVTTGELSSDAVAIDEATDAQADHLCTVAQAVHDARNDEIDAREFRTVELESRSVREAMEAVNSAGGFTMESYQFARHALNAPLSRVGISAPIAHPSNESLTETTRFNVSLEDIDALIDEIAATKDDVEKKSVDGVLRVLNALCVAVPDVKNRLIALREAVHDLTYDESKQIRLDAEIVKALAVGGKLPTGFKDFLIGYVVNANRILSGFNENAQVVASKAATLGDTLGLIGESSCPLTALNNAIKDIGDPRNGIEPDALQYELPGSGPLFGQKIDREDGESVAEDGAAADTVDQVASAVATAGDDEFTEEVRDRLAKFCNNNSPLDPLDWSDRADDAAVADEVRVLSKETIIAGLSELIKALEIVDIKSYGEAHRQTWMAARSAFSSYQAGKERMSVSQAVTLRPLDEDVCEYLDTVYELAVWPALHLLVNMVFTANAFVLLCERSISGQSAEVPEVPEIEEPVAGDEPTSTEPPTETYGPDETKPDANGETQPVVGGNGESADAKAATAADENNDELKPDENKDESGDAGAAV